MLAAGYQRARPSPQGALDVGFDAGVGASGYWFQTKRGDIYPMPEHPELNFVPRRVQTDPVAEALELFPYALYIVGSRGSDNINGMMADWVMQVSFEPRLM